MDIRELKAPVIKRRARDQQTTAMPMFTWDIVEGAVGYEFVLAEDLGQADLFAVIDYSATTSGNNHFARGSLKGGTRYNWRVRAFNSAARSPWSSSSFTTAPTAESANQLSSSVSTSAKIQILHIKAEDRKSVFIIYGGPDEEFASRLNQAVRDHGIETFFFPKQAIPGQKLHRLMSEELNRHDRTILVCSRNSLDRTGVLNEIEETLAREAREGGKAILIPVIIDNYAFNEWRPRHPDMGRAVRDRVAADFRDATAPGSLFDAQVKRLVEGIKTPG